MDDLINRTKIALNDAKGYFQLNGLNVNEKKHNVYLLAHPNSFLKFPSMLRYFLEKHLSLHYNQ